MKKRHIYVIMYIYTNIDGLGKTGDAPGHKPRLLLHQKGQKC